MPPPPIIIGELRPDRIGEYRHDSKSIVISPKVSHDEVILKELRDVVIHELIHAWVHWRGLYSSENNGHNAWFIWKAYYMGINLNSTFRVYPETKSIYDNVKNGWYPDYPTNFRTRQVAKRVTIFQRMFPYGLDYGGVKIAAGVLGSGFVVLLGLFLFSSNKNYTPNQPAKPALTVTTKNVALAPSVTVPEKSVAQQILEQMEADKKKREAKLRLSVPVKTVLNQNTNGRFGPATINVNEIIRKARENAEEAIRKANEEKANEEALARIKSLSTSLQ
jgi:hypothetical protein